MNQLQGPPIYTYPTSPKDHLEPFVVGATIEAKIDPVSSHWSPPSWTSVRLGALALVRLSSEPLGRTAWLDRGKCPLDNFAGASELSYFGVFGRNPC